MGVVFACEKIVTSKLYEAGANRRITNIDTHVGMAAAGLVTDARQLAEIARDEAATYRSDYGSPIPLPHLVQRVSSYMHAYTLYSSISSTASNPPALAMATGAAPPARRSLWPRR